MEKMAIILVVAVALVAALGLFFVTMQPQGQQYVPVPTLEVPSTVNQFGDVGVRLVPGTAEEKVSAVSTSFRIVPS